MSDDKLRVLWPDVTTDNGQQMAIHHGAWAACWIAVTHLLSVVFLAYTGEHFLAYTGKYPALMDAYAVSTIVAGDCIAILLGTFLSWRIWKRQGHVSAVVVLAWLLIEVLYNFVLFTGPGSVVFSILFAFAAINGVRGTFAHRQWLKEHEVSPG